MATPCHLLGPSRRFASCKRQQTAGRRASEQAQGLKNAAEKARVGYLYPRWRPFRVERQTAGPAQPHSAHSQRSEARKELRVVAQGYHDLLLPEWVSVCLSADCDLPHAPCNDQAHTSHVATALR